MSDIYEMHSKAFANVSAYVVLNKSGEKVATIAIKFPRDGAGRLYAYVHWLGVPMVRGHANGYGYDKRSAAVASAARKIVMPEGPEHAAFQKASCTRFLEAISIDSGEYWDNRLTKAGFTVLQAV